MERFIRRPEVNGVSSEEAEFVFTQAMYLGKMVRDLNLGEIYVNPIIEVRDRKYFDDKRTLAYTGICDLSVATVASSGTERSDPQLAPVTTMLIAPTKMRSGILADDKTETVYTDSFWVCKNGVFKYIKPTSPVPIDGICAIFDAERRDKALDPLTEANKALLEVTENKYKTREALARAGVPIPKGIFVTPMDNEGKIDTFVGQNPSRGWVTKEVYGSLGRGIEIFGSDAMEIAKLKDFVSKTIMYTGAGIIIEERIVPPADMLRVQAKHQENLDYNFRVITTLDKENPMVIDAEIRYREQNGQNKPVNIAIDAKASRVNTFDSPAIIKEIYGMAEETTRVLCQQVLKPGEKMLGIAGIDLMIDRNGKVYVIEANSGAVGGFGTLAKLDRKPLDSIKNVLAPATMLYLEDQFAKRGVADSRTLRRLPHNVNDFSVLFEMMFFAKKYDEAIRVLGVAKAKIPDQWEYILNGMIWIGIKTGNFDYALRYVDEFLSREPKDLDLAGKRVNILRMSKQYREAKAYIDTFSEEDKFVPGLFWGVFYLTLAERREQDAFKMLKKYLISHGFEYSDVQLCEKIAAGYKIVGDTKRWLIWKAKMEAAIAKERVITKAENLIIHFYTD